MPVAPEAAQEKSWSYERAEAEIAAAGYGEKHLEEFPCRFQSDGPHIMLVDDNQTNLMSLAGILRMKNYSITAVTSNEQFLEEFRGAGEVSWSFWT